MIVIIFSLFALATDDIFEVDKQDTRKSLQIMMESRQRVQSITKDNTQCKKEITLFCGEKQGPALGNCLLDARRTGKNFTESCRTYLHFKPSQNPSQKEKPEKINVR